MPLRGIFVSSYWAGFEGWPAFALAGARAVALESAAPSEKAAVLAAGITCIICAPAGAAAGRTRKIKIKKFIVR
ncbi:MAG: hypothetical protein A2X33_02795 [Elusimicrobia bacterium GWA2_51_34]|nr:MAG: hypothetical protein A2X33_02795 [Elusimicrobia bacterium GWA2_51_34]